MEVLKQNICSFNKSLLSTLCGRHDSFIDSKNITEPLICIRHSTKAFWVSKKMFNVHVCPRRDYTLVGELT